MKKAISYLVGAFTLLLILPGCDIKSKYYDYRLKLTNNTGKTIAAYYSINYPDTSLNAQYPNSIAANDWVAAAGSQITMARGGSWDVAFRDDIHSGRLSIFVFDNKLLQSATWDSIRANYLVLKRFDVTLDDLKNCNFVLTVN